MTVSLFTFVDLYRRHLVTAGHLLTKACDFAAANGISEAEMLGWRLHDDMHPLGFQLMVVANFARSWPARVADVPVPEAITADLDAAGFHAALADALAFLGQLTPEQFAGRDDVALTVQLTDTITPTLPAGHWLSVFATTNIAFHLSMIYAILRMKGVPLGKLDLFAAGL
ncbi:MAG: hypothetical protein C0474_07740 [Sphingobium sp.]|nr:hypothetical protein [Sphingobium sp.]